MSTSAQAYEADAPAKGFSGRTWPLLLSLYALICVSALALGVAEMTFAYVFAAAVFCAAHAALCGPEGKMLLAPAGVQALGVAALLFFLLQAHVTSAHTSHALAHFLVAVQLITLYGLHRMRDVRLIQVTAIFQLLIAAISTADVAFLPAFALAGACLIVNMIVVEMHRTETDGQVAATVPSVREILSAFWLPAALILVVTAVAFLSMPRLRWASGGRPGSGSLMTGFSEDVSLQEVGSLRQSEQVVFSVRFALLTRDGIVPYRPDPILMRAVSLPLYRNGRWLGHGYPLRDVVRGQTAEDGPPQSEFLSDEVYMLENAEVSRRRVLQRVQLRRDPPNVLFALYRPIEVPGTERERVLVPLSHHLRRTPRQDDWRSYNAISLVPQFSADQLRGAGTPEPTAQLSAYWEIPGDIQPVLEQTAREIERIYAPTTDYDRLMAAQRYLMDPQRFSYTLELPPFGQQDPISAFLTETKRGSCEQFATALALLARTWGIPTRLVVGFKEGAFDADTQRHVFRDLDAHAWVEAYFNGLGWVEFDPTPASEVATDGNDEEWGVLGAFAEHVSRQIDRLRDLVRAGWGTGIVGYTRSQQTKIFRALNEAVTNLARDLATVFSALIPAEPDLGLAPVGVTVLLFTLTALALYLLGRWLEMRLNWSTFRPRARTLRFYEQLLRILRRKGVKRPACTTARQLAREAARQLAESNDDPRSLRQAIELVTDLYCRARFGRHELTAQEREAVQAALKTLSQARRASAGRSSPA